MALRSIEWWLQGCVLSLEGYASSFGVGGWVGCYIVGVSRKCNQIKKKIFLKITMHSFGSILLDLEIENG